MEKPRARLNYDSPRIDPCSTTIRDCLSPRGAREIDVDMLGTNALSSEQEIQTSIYEDCQTLSYVGIPTDQHEIPTHSASRVRQRVVTAARRLHDAAARTICARTHARCAAQRRAWLGSDPKISGRSAGDVYLNFRDDLTSCRGPRFEALTLYFHDYWICAPPARC